MKKIVLLIFFIIKQSKEFSFENYDYNNILINPYRVLGLPPWSSMKEIKMKYRNLIKKYHPDKTKGKTKKEFELIQTAYEKIKQERNNQNEEEESINFKSMIKKTIKEIIIVEIIFNVIYYISYWTYSIQKILIKPLFYIVFSCVFINSFLPHFFNDENTEFFTGVFIGFFIFLFKRILQFCRKKNKEKNQ